MDDAVEHYQNRYADIGWLENSLYEGVLAELSSIKAQGFQLCVTTSKPSTYACKITKHFGVAVLMDYEFGSESDGTRADKTSLIKYAITLYNATTGKSIMVGDRPYDVVGVKNNGLPFVRVAYGYGGHQELKIAGATKIISKPADLSNVITAILG